MGVLGRARGMADGVGGCRLGWEGGGEGWEGWVGGDPPGHPNRLKCPGPWTEKRLPEGCDRIQSSTTAPPPPARHTPYLIEWYPICVRSWPGGGMKNMEETFQQI